MQPRTFSGVSPEWIVLATAPFMTADDRPDAGERRAFYALVVHAANSCIIKSLAAPSALRDPLRALAELNTSWRDVALLGVAPSEFENALRRLTSTQRRSQPEWSSS